MTKYINKLREHFNNQDYPVFTLIDIRIFLSDTKISKRYLKMLINHLIKKKEIVRIAKGVYTFHKEITVVGFAFRPFYYGLEDALTYRNFWTQSTNPIVLTPKNVRQGLRKFDGSNYIVKRIKPSLFFGFNFVKHYDFWLPVSDPEKTLIDLVYYNHDVRDDALEKLLEILNRDRLEEYLEYYNNVFRKKILIMVDSKRKAIATLK